jgi:hypothetical protein
MICIDNKKRYFGIVDEAGVGRAAMVAAGIIHNLAPFIPDQEMLQKIVGVAGVHDYTDQYDWTHQTVLASMAEKGIEVPRYKTRVANKQFADTSFIMLAVCNPVMLPLFIKRHPNIFVHVEKDPPENSKESIDKARDSLTLLASLLAVTFILGEISSRKITGMNEIATFRRYRLTDETTRNFLPVYSHSTEVMSHYENDTEWMREEHPLFQLS